MPIFFPHVAIGGGLSLLQLVTGRLLTLSNANPSAASAARYTMYLVVLYKYYI